MKLVLSVLAFVACASAASVSFAPVDTEDSFASPYERNPIYKVTHKGETSLFKHWRKNAPDERVDIFVPSPAKGSPADTPKKYPVVLFLGGLSGDCPVFAYRQSLEHIASHGIITVAVTTLTLPRAQRIADSMKQIVDWMDKKLPGIVSKVDGVQADLSRLVVSGHSSAAHVVINLVNTYGCGNIKGLFLASPIDGSDPWGIIKDNCITDGEMLNFTTPTFMMEGELATIPGRTGLPACSPLKLGLDHFSGGINSPAWTLSIKGFGHADIIEPPYLNVVTLSGFCAVNSDNTNQDYARMRKYFAGTMVSFIRAVTEPSLCSVYRPFLEDPEAMLSGMNVDVKRKPLSRDQDVCGMGCYSPLDN